MAMTQLVLHIENKSVAASLKKVLATMDGVTIASAKDLTAYEKSKLEARAGKVNTYSSVDLFLEAALKWRLQPSAFTSQDPFSNPEYRFWTCRCAY